MLEFDLKALCEQVSVSLYDDELVSENGRKIYRVYIAKKGGVSLEECAKLSEILSPILDVKPPCAGEYSLEVSSPGLERRLVKPQHFELSVGERAVFVMSDKSKIVGEILGISKAQSKLNADEKDTTSISVRDENGEQKELNLSEIKKAKTFVEW